MDIFYIILCSLLIGTIGYGLGQKYGRSSAVRDFQSQVNNQKDFYEHNLKAECKNRKFTHLIGE